MSSVSVEDLAVGAKFSFLENTTPSDEFWSGTFVLISKKQLGETVERDFKAGEYLGLKTKRNWEIVFDPHPLESITEISAVVSSDILLYGVA
jgi:hypothetical protein